MKHEGVVGYILQQAVIHWSMWDNCLFFRTYFPAFSLFRWLQNKHPYPPQLPCSIHRDICFFLYIFVIFLLFTSTVSLVSRLLWNMLSIVKLYKFCIDCMTIPAMIFLPSIFTVSPGGYAYLEYIMCRYMQWSVWTLKWCEIFLPSIFILSCLFRMFCMWMYSKATYWIW